MVSLNFNNCQWAHVCFQWTTKKIEGLQFRDVLNTYTIDRVVWLYHELVQIPYCFV